MIDLNTFLLMIISLLGIILLICLIILSIRLINTIDRFNNILDDVDEKISKFDKTFQLVDILTDNMALVSDKIVDGISNFIRRFVGRKRKVDDNNE